MFFILLFCFVSVAPIPTQPPTDAPTTIPPPTIPQAKEGKTSAHFYSLFIFPAILKSLRFCASEFCKSVKLS